MNDFRFALRQLLKNPGFTAVVVLMLGLGIGLNTAIFSVVNAVLLRPLPYPEPEQLVQVLKNAQPPWATRPELKTSLAVPEILAWQQRSRVFARLAAYDVQGANLTGGDAAERVDCGKVTASFLSALGVPPRLGRDFLPAEDRPGGPAVAILSYSLWQQRFGGDANVLGRTITLDAKPHTVVGVLPATFAFTPPCDVLVPLVLRPEEFALPQVIGRLRPGVNHAQAQAELDTIYQAARNPKEKGQVVVVSLRAQRVRGVRLSLLVFLGAAGFVLLIACANVANLLLARAARRQKEMAVRLALGAGRRRIVRQLMTESVLFAALGALLGLLLALWGKELLRAFIPERPRLPVDGWVLAFTFLAALATSLLFGLAPAWGTARVSLNEALSAGGRTGAASGQRQHRLSRLLVVSEVALALVLLAGAGLLAHSYLRLRGVETGFRPDRILSLSIVLSRPQYRDARAQAAYFQQVIEGLRGLPGVEAVGANAALPFTPFAITIGNLEIEGQPSPGPGEYRVLRGDVVNEDYFRALGIPLRKGRWFTEDDRDGQPAVALVNERFAKRYFPDTDPLGKRLGTGKDAMTIVGVVGDVRHYWEAPPEPQIYRPYRQAGTWVMSLAVRTAGDPLRLAAAVRSRILSLDKDQPVYGLMTLEQRLADTLAPRRRNLQVVGALGALALALAALGIYGVLSFLVAQRTHEIGVRMALGAHEKDVLWLVVSHGVRLAGVGVLAGLFAAFWLTRLLSTMLWGVNALDPATFAGVSVILLLVAALACWFPARRAARTDPMEALRYE